MFYSLLYSIVMLLALPVMLLRRAARSKYLPSLRERFGLYRTSINKEGKPAIWLHAVSVGETLAARSLVAALRTAWPAHKIFVSTTTLTGQKIARENLDADGFFYFPFDWKFSVRRALQATQARICVVMETELWPNFVRTLSDQGIPLVLVNGRISDRSFRRYSKLRWFFKPLLRRFASLCAQSELDAERLRQLGAHPFNVVNTGNLKYGKGQFDVSPGRVDKLRQTISLEPDTPLFVAGSTHEGEEEAVLDAFEYAREEIPALRLAIAPRKPERFDDVAELLRARGTDFGRITEMEEKPDNTSCILVDTIGHLQALYHLATVAFVGGSLVPRGGHNLLEATAAGVPVLFGPHMNNFRAVAEDVLEHGAGVSVAGPQELTTQLAKLLSDEKLYDRMSRAALTVLEENQEALPLTLKEIEKASAYCGARYRPPLYARALAALHSRAAAVLRGDPGKELAAAKRLSRPVLSVGGLSFGGSGKTPMAALLANYYLAEGKRVALLTRGYGGKSEEPLVVSDGHMITHHPELQSSAGDEAAMLALSHPGLIVIKDRNRFRGGALAEEKFNPDIFILDDGFQHRSLGRDFNLLMLDADSLCAPKSAAQLFREPLKFAAAADAIALLADNGVKQEFAKEHLHRAGATAPVFAAHWQPESLTDFKTGARLELGKLAGSSVVAFAGIGAPHRFFASLNETAIRTVATRVFPDHYQYSELDIGRLVTVLKDYGADAIITSAKDAQRLYSFDDNILAQSNILVLNSRLVIEAFDRLIEMIDSSLEQ